MVSHEHIHGAPFFVGIDMRCCRADDSAPTREQGLQGKDVGPCSIEDRIGAGSCPEVGLDDNLKRCCVDIFAVCGDVAFVGCLNCFDDFGVSPGVAIRGEAPVCRVVQAPRQYLWDACYVSTLTLMPVHLRVGRP